MVLPEDLEDVEGGDFCGAIRDEDGFGVPGQSGTHFLVGGVRGEAAHVTDTRRGDSRQLPVQLLRTPKAPHSEVDALEIAVFGVQGRAEDRVAGRHGEDLPVATRKGRR